MFIFLSLSAVLWQLNALFSMLRLASLFLCKFPTVYAIMFDKKFMMVVGVVSSWGRELVVLSPSARFHLISCGL